MATLVEFAKAQGIELLPWQRDLAEGFERGEKVTYPAAREAGRTKMFRLLNEWQEHKERAEPVESVLDDDLLRVSNGAIDAAIKDVVPVEDYGRVSRRAVFDAGLERAKGIAEDLQIDHLGTPTFAAITSIIRAITAEKGRSSRGSDLVVWEYGIYEGLNRVFVDASVLPGDADVRRTPAIPAGPWLPVVRGEKR